MDTSDSLKASGNISVQYRLNPPLAKSFSMTQNYDSIEDRIIRLKTELELIIESLDPSFEEQKRNVEESLVSTNTTFEKGSKIENMINIDVENKGFWKKCYIM